MHLLDPTFLLICGIGLLAWLIAAIGAGLAFGLKAWIAAKIAKHFIDRP
jgi:hypothetical protein